MDRSFGRPFRNAEYPLLRGTFLSSDANSQILYTRGSVDSTCDVLSLGCEFSAFASLSY